MPGGSAATPLSRTPWAGGSRPVRIEQCAGSVSGDSRQRVPEARPRSSEGIEIRRQRDATLDPSDVVRPRRIERDQNDGRGSIVAAASQPSRRSGVKPTIMGSDPAQKKRARREPRP